MAEFLRTQPEPSDLLTVAYEGITVARIDCLGLFHCYDQAKMIESLRGQADQLQAAMLQLGDISHLAAANASAAAEVGRILGRVPVIDRAESGTYRWVHVAVEGGVTQDVREKFRQDLKGLSVDTCPAPGCGSSFVVHIESAKGVRHICAECFETWGDCHWVPAKEVT